MINVTPRILICIQCVWLKIYCFRNPTPLGEQDPLIKINWPSSGNEGHCLDLNNEFTVIPRPTSELVKASQIAAEKVMEC